MSDQQEYIDSLGVLFTCEYIAPANRKWHIKLTRGDSTLEMLYTSLADSAPQLTAILKYLARMDALASMGLLQQADGMQIESKAELDAYFSELARALVRRPVLHKMFTGVELANLAN